MIRDIEEIQAAHDRLVSILLGQVPNPWPEQEGVLRSACDVLCWVLKHDHNVSFAENLEAIDAFLREQGIMLVKRPGGTGT